MEEVVALASSPATATLPLARGRVPVPALLEDLYLLKLGAGPFRCPQS